MPFPFPIIPGNNNVSFPFPNFGNGISIPVPKNWEWNFHSRSRSQKLGMQFIIPVPVPKVWELGWAIPIPVPKCPKVIPAHPWAWMHGILPCDSVSSSLLSRLQKKNAFSACNLFLGTWNVLTMSSLEILKIVFEGNIILKSLHECQNRNLENYVAFWKSGGHL